MNNDDSYSFHNKNFSREFKLKLVKRVTILVNFINYRFIRTNICVK